MIVGIKCGAPNVCTLDNIADRNGIVSFFSEQLNERCTYGMTCALAAAIVFISHAVLLCFCTLLQFCPLTDILPCLVIDSRQRQLYNDSKKESNDGTSFSLT